MGNFGNRENFQFPVFANFPILESGESKKHKISMLSWCSLVSMLVCLLVCRDDVFRTNRLKNFVWVLK